MFVAFTFQQKLIYISAPVTVQANHFYKFKVGDNQTEAFIIENGSDTDLIYFQGNAMDQFTHIFAQCLQAKTGYNVIMFIYRGYAQSTGRSSEVNIMVDMHILKNFMERRKTKVNVFAHSLGCAAAVYYSTIAKTNKLVLNNGFLNLKNVVKRFTFGSFLSLFITEKWETNKRIGKLDNEILFLCSSNDKLINNSNSESLKNLCKNAKLIVTKNTNHNDFSQDENYFNYIVDFFR
ncbi:bem46 protein [Binucleata daphniae]